MLRSLITLIVTIAVAGLGADLVRVAYSAQQTARLVLGSTGV
ncbi:MAG: hypothetical protein JWO85_445 [Candidatus Eremiobacteraeota bacterium]|jgi:hypothetical protein|nr:hypothetical protein [Candidatus Eremiobacteraeota bacterium]